MGTRHGNCKYPAKTAWKVFRMVDGGCPVAKAANALELPYATAYRLLEEEEGRQGRKAKRSRREVKMPGADKAASSRGGKKAQAQKKAGYAESHAEHLARLAPLLEEVTRQHARRNP